MHFHIQSLLPAEVPSTAVSPFPLEGLVYDWCWSSEVNTWVDWMSTVPAFTVNVDMPFSQIIVPTSDTVRYTHITRALLCAGKHVLCVGDTGTGDTVPAASCFRQACVALDVQRCCPLV